MFNKILVITDNLEQGIGFQTVIEELQICERFEFAISPFSNLELFSKNISDKVNVINLKDDNTISYLINRFDLIFSIHCKQLFPKRLIQKTRCINIHPGYNPINRGWYPQVFAILNNTPVGATIHEIDEKLDHGNIIARSFVEKNVWDTSESLYNKILALELDLLRKYLPKILEGNYSTFPPENPGNLYFKKDFETLKEINLNESGTFSSFLNRLRALTHKNFKNAYFIDKTTGKKIFVTLSLEVEN